MWMWGLLKLPGFLNFLKYFDLHLISPSMLHRKTAVVEILTCSSHFCNYLSSCPSFYGWLFNKILSRSIPSWTQMFRYWIQNLWFFKDSDQIFHFVFRMVHVEFFGGKNSRGYPLKIFVKKLPGETLCNFFQIFPPKVLVYRGHILRWHFCK